MSKHFTKAQSLADAIVKIARANHYMVGLNQREVKELDEEDISGAREILVDMENKGKFTDVLADRIFDIFDSYFKD